MACELAGPPAGVFGGTQMDSITKLKVKVGLNEFEAEGPADQVAAQFETWRQLLAASPPAAPAIAAGTPVIPAANVTEVKTRDGFSAPWDIFQIDEKHNLVTLKVHPPAGESRDADAILLILFGYRKAGNGGAGASEVPVTKLKESLEVSGLRIERIDRAVAGYLASGFVLKSGRAKGGIYRLSNTGYTRAEEMAQRLFAQIA
jgi:hypothetical protein